MQILAVFQVSNVLHTLSVQIDSWIQNSQYEYFFFFRYETLQSVGVTGLYTPFLRH